MQAKPKKLFSFQSTMNKLTNTRVIYYTSCAREHRTQETLIGTRIIWCNEQTIKPQRSHMRVSHMHADPRKLSSFQATMNGLTNTWLTWGCIFLYPAHGDTDPEIRKGTRIVWCCRYKGLGFRVRYRDQTTRIVISVPKLWSHGSQ
jgi:hypothetical protein